MDIIVYLTVLLLTGVFVGFTSGLLGVGGGFIMGPVQFFLLIAMGVDPNIAIRVAFATSLAVILPTAISGALGHNRRGAVLLRPAVLLGSAGFIGGALGALTATNMSADILRIISGVLILISAAWMLKSHSSESVVETSNKDCWYLFWGFIGGISSGLLGIGGG
ncbi:MAG TPA: sulfite exporter TauE/SafE family protein, partial [Methanobacteriaceae archaeon]|nr:sulfite exporter TauE/SafE family protein [Methanobacteriaceae archaeon]